jgi:hypothetical protein
LLIKDEVKLRAIKPSTLPENTIIEDVYFGKFIKEAGGVWVEVHAAEGEKPIEVSSDDQFNDFDILAVPLGWKIPPPPRRPEAIWKRIPKHPNYEVSNDGRVKRVGQATGKAKAKSKTTGNYVLYEKGQPVPWNESHIGDAKAIEAFFSC